MKLVKCRKCKKEVSKSARVCPHCGKKKSRKISWGLAIFILFFVAMYLIGITVDDKKSPTEKTTVKAEVKAAPTPKPFKYADMTLKEYRNEAKHDRKDIVDNYVSYKNISGAETVKDNFYNCLSEISYTKSDELRLDETLGWCYNDYSKNPDSLSNRINFDEFKSKFSTWDGSYRPLTKIIKENMHDESTYKHIETTYRSVLNANPYAIVTTIFSGTNRYGARVKQSLTAKVDIKTGEIIELITEQ